MEDHPIYTALTRPKLIKGVPRDYALLSMILAVICFELSTPFLDEVIARFLVGGTAFLILWIIGWLLAKKDPEFLQVIRIKRTIINQTKGVGKYEGNRYIP
ncbi:MAG: hypothetical protein COC22_00155 [Flavobacteriaceae bacterium]|nr:MAG: hypothetical protein COC22_00155 [Flavobacteriaceae bacterium]